MVPAREVTPEDCLMGGELEPDTVADRVMHKIEATVSEQDEAPTPPAGAQ